MALRTSSTTQVPTIHLSSSVCVQLPWFIVSAQAEHNLNISLDLLLYGSTGWYIFLGGRTLHFIISSLSKQSRGQSAHTSLSGDLQGTYRTYKCSGTDWYRPHNGLRPHAWHYSIFSWPRFYHRTKHPENLLENALHMGARKFHFGGQDYHKRLF